MLDKTGTVTTGRMTLARRRTGRRRGRDRGCCGSPARWRHASEHPIAQAVADGAAERSRAAAAGRRTSPTSTGLGVTGHRRRARGARRPARGCSPSTVAARCRRELERAVADAEAAGRTAVAGRLGRRRRAASSSSPTRSSRPAAEADRRTARPRPHPGPADRRQRHRRPRGRRRGRHRPRSIAEVLPADKVDVVKRLQAEGRVGGDGRRRRQRRRRPRPGRPGAGHGHRHRRRDRGRRPDPGTRRPERRRRRDPALPRARSAPSRATCSGPSPTTWPRCRWPPPGCSTR